MYIMFKKKNNYFPLSLDLSVFTCVSYVEARNSYRLDVRPSVRLSVRPSHAGIVSKRLNLSSRPGSPMILVLCGPKFSRNSNGNILNGGVKCKGVEKKFQFPTDISL